MKVRNALTLKPNTVPTNPESGDIYYDQTLKAFYYYQNGQWVNLSSLGGSKNYLTPYTASTSGGTANIGNGNAELGATTGWSLGTIGTLTNGLPTGSPTFGSGASSNLTLSTVSSGQIGGAYSFSYASSAATTQGNMMASSAFYIDSGDQGKVLTWKVYFTASSGTATANWSGTSNNSFGVAIWDATNSVWLPTIGAFGLTQSSGVGYATGTVQTGITTAQMRLCIYNVNATSGAITMLFDDISIGPQTSPIGPAMTDWNNNPWTPTGSMTTNTTYTGYWRRVGDTMECQVHLAWSGAPNAVSLTVNLPTGYSINTSKILNTNGTLNNLGVGLYAHTGAQTYPLIVTYNSSTAIGVNIFQNGSGAGSVNGGQTFTSTEPATIASGDILDIIFSVPIQGWSSNLNMSNDTDTRVVAAAATFGSGSVTSGTQINFSTVSFDTHGAITTGSSWKYTAPVTGYYSVALTGMSQSSAGNSVYVYKNGSVGPQIGLFPVASTPGNGSLTIQMNAGDFIDLRPNATLTITGGYLCIQRLSGPAVVAATESVNMRYHGSSSSLGTVAAPDAVSYATKDFDTHNAYSGSTYTVPVSGKYQINASLYQSAASNVIAQAAAIYIYHNGAQVSATTTYFPTSTTFPMSTPVSDIVSCSAGDTIQIYAGNGGTTPSIGADNLRNFISISRVGN